jgi:hypothetical protein
MIPLGLLGSLLSPVHIPAWRTGAVFAVTLVVGSAMLFLARSLERGRAWARTVGMAVLATFTATIGLFAFTVARSEDAGDAAGYAVLSGLVVGDSRWRDVSDSPHVGPPRTFHRSAITRRKRFRRGSDCEEDRTLRAVLVGMLREDERH